MPHDDPPELGNEDPEFLSLLEQARAGTDRNPYPALWLDAYFGGNRAGWRIGTEMPAAARTAA